MKNAMAIAAPILSEKVEEWKQFSYSLDQAPRNAEFTAFMKQCGVSRIRCWMQKGPEGASPTAIVLYEGETPEEFAKQIGTSDEPFAVWFRERILTLNGMDMNEPLGPPPELVTDAQAE